MHLNEVFNRIIKYHPYDAFDKFEEISNLVKKTAFIAKEPKYDYEINGNAGKQNSLSHKQALQFIEKAKNLLQEKPDVKKQDRGLLTRNQALRIPNLEVQSQMLEWAGVDFGEENIYLMQKSLKRLATMSGATSLRFFGKIYGSKLDYWVAQG